MKLLFRADAGPHIGAGHMMRNLALAQACRAADCKVVFACAEELATVSERFAAEEFEIVKLDAEPGSERDVHLTAAMAADFGASWVVADGYCFGAEYQKGLKARKLRLLLLDDYAHADTYHADFVLNQNAYADRSLYGHRDNSARLLLGSKFVLLRREYLQWDEWTRTVPDIARKVLVTFGGVDPTGSTAKAVHALEMLGRDDLETVVVGAPESLGGRKLPAQGFRLETGVSDMAKWMAWADVAISAAGSTCWEQAYMGLPQIVSPIAKNQRAVAESAAALGCAMNAGWHAELTADSLAGSIQLLLADKSRRARMAEAGRKVVDGKGATRVVMHLRSRILALQFVGQEDAKLIWRWANSPEVRSAAFNSEPIPWEDHLRWFETKLSDRDCLFFLARNEAGEPVGQVRFDLEGRDATVDASIDRKFRGQGYGSAVILRASEELFSTGRVDSIHAYIKPANEPSLKAFERVGFRRLGETSMKGHKAVHFLAIREFS